MAYGQYGTMDVGSAQCEAMPVPVQESLTVQIQSRLDYMQKHCSVLEERTRRISDKMVGPSMDSEKTPGNMAKMEAAPRGAFEKILSQISNLERVLGTIDNNVSRLDVL